MSEFMDEALSVMKDELSNIAPQLVADIECPHCKKPLHEVPMGISTCPYCGQEIELMPNFQTGFDFH